MVAAWKIGAADRPREQNVADERDLGALVIDHDMAGRVTRRVRDVEAHAFELQRVAVHQIAIGRDVAAAFDPIPA